MFRLSLVLLLGFVMSSTTIAQDSGEHIVVTGGPAMPEWERYKMEPHDNWWMNFVRASRLRIEQLRNQYGPSSPITWLVHQKAYQRRQLQEKQNLFSIIESVRDKYGLKLVYFNTPDQLCAYLNNGLDRSVYKIGSFDYFGHSNRACFMIDYSNEIASGSKVWLHETELKQKLHRGIFARNAEIKSWGCYTGESMAKLWYRATGAKMIGALGKTQYMTNELPVLSTSKGRWVTGL